MKKIVGNLHLWLGLGSGLIVLIVSLTGCIFVFEEEIFNRVHARVVYHQTPVNSQVKPLSQLRAIAQKALGEEKRINSVEMLRENNRAYVFSAVKRNKEEGWNYFQEAVYWEEAYVNPYTGEVLGIVDRKYEFFNLIRRMHQNLLLRYEIGSMIVGSACLIFLVLLITGFILWIPKSKAGWKQRFTIKWKAKWRRVNYDSHNVGGFYVLPIAIIIVATGLVWSFDWWEEGFYKVLGEKEKPQFKMEQPKSASPVALVVEPIDQAWQSCLAKGLVFERISLSFPEKKDQGIRVFVQLNSGSGWRTSNYYYYHSQTGEQFGQLLQEDKTLGMKWRNTNYDIHTGSVYGLASKILAFLASLVCASLPVTGFYIWWGKKKKRKPARVKKGMEITSPVTSSSKVKRAQTATV